MDFREMFSGKKVDTEDLYFLLFCLPGFELVSDIKEISGSCASVIFNGNLSEFNIRKLRSSASSFVLISPYADIVLRSVSDYIRVFAPKQSRLIEQYELMSMDYFLSDLKVSLVLGKPLPGCAKQSGGTYELFKSLLSSPDKVLGEYIRCLDEMPVNVVLASILTFLSRVQSGDWDSLSPSYKSLLNRSKLKFGHRVQSSLLGFLKTSRVCSPEVSLLRLLGDLNG